MKKAFWVIIFLLILVVELIGVQLNNLQLQYIAKPLMMPALALYFFNETKNTTSNLKKWMLLALFFSWAGDVILLFQEQRSIFFLLGLSAFLLAHIFYIILFHHIRVNENVKSRAWTLIIVAVYYAGLMFLLSPYLADMKIPVRVYGVVISFMFMLAMHLLFIRNTLAGKWILGGALLFVISDSILAINKFYHSFELAGIIIMITYGLAQLFITEGIARYIRSANSN